MARALVLKHEQDGCPRMGINRYAELRSIQQSDIAVEPLTWRTIDIEGGSLINVPDNAAYFVTVDQERFMIRLSFDDDSNSFAAQGDARFNSSTNEVQIIAASLESAERSVQWLERQGSESSLLRKNAVQVFCKDASPSVRIVTRPTVESQRIVLPDAITSLIEKLIRQHDRFRTRCETFRFSRRLGLLLYGPPGTGKTLMIRRVVDLLPQHTLIMPSDLQPETLRSVFRYATYLQPAIIAIEDIDLLAVRRDRAHAKLDGLQELMNEMDGLVSEHELLIILTTNRPDVVEPALASRPGRISQAIEFSLPTAAVRERLMRIFLGNFVKEAFDVETWVRRTDGASPAFLEELCKRAMMSAHESSADGAGFVTNADFDQAMFDLITTGGNLNAGILGFPVSSKGPSN